MRLMLLADRRLTTWGKSSSSFGGESKVCDGDDVPDLSSVVDDEKVDFFLLKTNND